MMFIILNNITVWNLPSITKGIKHNPAYRLVSNVSPWHLGLCFGKGWTYLNNWSKQALNILSIKTTLRLHWKKTPTKRIRINMLMLSFSHKFINRQISLSFSLSLLPLTKSTSISSVFNFTFLLGAYCIPWKIQGTGMSI